MRYRLEAITQSVTAQACALCHRKHKVVVTFRELVFTVPADMNLPVQESDGACVVTTGTSCARKFLEKVATSHRSQALARLDALMAS